MAVKLTIEILDTAPPAQANHNAEAKLTANLS